MFIRIAKGTAAANNRQGGDFSSQNRPGQRNEQLRPSFRADLALNKTVQELREEMGRNFIQSLKFLRQNLTN